ncbi:MAG TPA: M20/M25/M40 family metallo-hydrolase, partial [Roseiflexaceae bacterium]|nr:M20/M25/M40 family metallo-hydrolase [Roseiflexaceae bacterium]
MNTIERLMREPAVRAACDSFGDGAEVVEAAIAIQQIAAPTFDEGRRGDFVQERMRALGLADVERDGLGNVYGRLPGRGSGQGLLIAAHLDTVFPAATDLSIRREGQRIYGPGLGDNSLGVAGLLHLADSMVRHKLARAGDTWFVANVGEEGLGDLRGMRAAVDRLHGQIGAAIALEGTGQDRVIHAAIGVRRYRIAVATPGGHSWQDFGAPSAIHILARIAEQITRLEVPREPRTTFNIGVIEGGTSVNTIAQHASLLLDLRSVVPAHLAALVRQVEQIIGRARIAAPEADIRLETVGDRPAGSIPTDHPLVRAATGAYEAMG